jgi:AraC-like DNA-binding protein
LLDQPVAKADPALRKILERRILDSWHSGDLDTMTQLRRALRVGLLRGDVSAVGISMQIGIGRRTLQRRLDALGFGFQDALDEARCEFVKQLLANTKLGIGEIGSIVGYADPSVLTRGFTRWVGMTPSEWRINCETRPGSTRLQRIDTHD